MIDLDTFDHLWETSQRYSIESRLGSAAPEAAEAAAVAERKLLAHELAVDAERDWLSAALQAEGRPVAPAMPRAWYRCRLAGLPTEEP